MRFLALLADWYAYLLDGEAVRKISLAISFIIKSLESIVKNSFELSNSFLRGVGVYLLNHLCGVVWVFFLKKVLLKGEGVQEPRSQLY